MDCKPKVHNSVREYPAYHHFTGETSYITRLIRPNGPSLDNSVGLHDLPDKRAWLTVRETRDLTHGRRRKGRIVSEIESYTHEVAVDSMAVNEMWQRCAARVEQDSGKDFPKFW